MSAPSKHADTIHALLEQASGPMSANELWQSLQSTGMGLATIYRVLKRGSESGALREADLPGGQTRYEPAGRKHHHHFLCSDCDRAIDVEGCVAGLEKLVPPDFTITSHEILLFGHCADCASAA